MIARVHGPTPSPYRTPPECALRPCCEVAPCTRWSACVIQFGVATIDILYNSVLLRGDPPRLLDEWQVVPKVWNHVRHACDATAEKGLFILAGSARPVDDITRHTGAGRVRRVRMRPMSLFESSNSSSEVSVDALLAGGECSAARPEAALRDVAALLCRGGWPAQIGLPPREVQQNLRDYVAEVARTDVGLQGGGSSHDPAGVERLLRSLAQNTATEVSESTLAADVEPVSLHRHTVREYLSTLQRLFVVEDQPSWLVRLRSRARLRKSAKRHLVDPSLAAAVLGADPDRLMADASTFGRLFESLVVRDLRILTQPLGGNVFHFRDSTGLEGDAIVELPDGRWMAVEVKLGGSEAVDTAAQSLLRLKRKVEDLRRDQLAALVVVTAVGYGYTRTDGVRVVPLTALAP